MTWLYDIWLELVDWWPALLTLLAAGLSIAFIAWVLMTKTDSTSAVAWCLLIILLPFVGSILFFFFGYQHVNRPLQRKRRHKRQFQFPGHAPGSGSFGTEPAWEVDSQKSPLCASLARLADCFGAYPLTPGNHIEFYKDGPPAFAAISLRRIPQLNSASVCYRSLLQCTRPRRRGRQASVPPA